MHRSVLGETLASVLSENRDDIRQWLDLSTSTPPWSWPVTHVPEHVWRHKAHVEGLESDAGNFYGSGEAQVVALQGAQQAVETIPGLIEPLRVAIPRLGYDEHEYHWRQAGHHIHYYRSFKELLALVTETQVDAAVVINPNNPTGVKIPRAHMLDLQQVPTLQLLLLDETLAELEPSNSIVDCANHPNTVVLRTLSKFYGLAGMQLGFAMGGHRVLSDLRLARGVWPVSNVAAHVAPALFADTEFYERQKARIDGACRQLVAKLERPFADAKILSGGLFVTVIGRRDSLDAFYQAAFDQAVLLKRGYYDDNTAWLRIGIAKHYLQFRDVCEQFSESS